AIADDGSIALDSQRALALLREAYGELATAEKLGVDPGLIAPLRARAVHGLDFLYGAKHAKANRVLPFASGAQPTAMSIGPTSDSSALYYIDSASGTVNRVDPTSKTPTSVQVVQIGDHDPGGADIAAPRFLSVGGLDLLIVDARGDLWRWRP